MSKKKETAPEMWYTTERLLESRALSGYQQDFARAILKAPHYTISGAKAALDAVLKKGDK